MRHRTGIAPLLIAMVLASGCTAPSRRRRAEPEFDLPWRAPQVEVPDEEPSEVRDLAILLTLEGTAESSAPQEILVPWSMMQPDPWVEVRDSPTRDRRERQPRPRMRGSRASSSGPRGHCNSDQVFHDLLDLALRCAFRRW